MEAKLTRKVIWNEAARTGIALGAVSVAYIFITYFLDKIPAGAVPGILTMILSFALRIAKIVGCIMILRHAMIKLASDYSEASNRHTYRLGLASSILSALIVAAAYMFHIQFIAMDEILASMDAMMGMMGSIMDHNSLEAAKDMADNLPLASFISVLFYCFVYGWILSAILSANIPAKNPFKDEE